jgi:predicted unusual protein kinase regulating ubiquinone biosynthesis (AarF/ABC1/UbiB family)
MVVLVRLRSKEQKCSDPSGFRAAMAEHFRSLRELVALEEEAHDLSAVNQRGHRRGAEALAAVLETVRQYKVSLPGHICAVVVTTLVLEGWSNQLDPEHSVLAQVQRPGRRTCENHAVVARLYCKQHAQCMNRCCGCCLVAYVARNDRKRRTFARDLVVRRPMCVHTT